MACNCVWQQIMLFEIEERLWYINLQRWYWVTIRLSQICTFLPNNFFPKNNNFIPLFWSKALQKTENWKFLCIFSLASSRLKFYYITHYVKWSYQENLNFFQFFITKLYFFLLNLNSLWKMCSFEVHHVDIAQKLRKLKGGS